MLNINLGNCAFRWFMLYNYITMHGAKDPSLYYPPIYALVFQVVSFPQVSPPKPCKQLSSTPYVLLDLMSVPYISGGSW